MSNKVETGGTHWSLLYLGKLASGHMFMRHYDPSGRTNHALAMGIAHAIMNVWESFAGLTQLHDVDPNRIPQSPRNDCGVAVTWMMRMLVNRIFAGADLDAQENAYLEPLGRIPGASVLVRSCDHVQCSGAFVLGGCGALLVSCPAAIGGFRMRATHMW